MPNTTTTTTPTTSNTTSIAPTLPQVRVMYSQVIGTLGTFEINSDVRIYFDHLKNFFEANGITDESKKRAILLSSVSEDAYKLLYSLCMPTDPNRSIFQHIIKIFKRSFRTKKIVLCSQI